MTRKVISELCGDYLSAYDQVMLRKYGSRFNMFVMRKDIFHQYCEWLYNILFEVEKQLDISNYSAYDSRVFGFISERLLDVYVLKNQIPYETLPVLNLESQRWGRKIFNFILRKVSRGRFGRQK